MPDERVVVWSRLSPRGFEILRVVALRATAGYESKEIAEAIEADRGSVREVLPLPPRPLNAHWVNQMMRELREEIELVSDDTAD